MSAPVILDHTGRPVTMRQLRRRGGRQAMALATGFKGANDRALAEWTRLPLEINAILRNDLRQLRARSRDLARNDDTTKRFLHLLKQNVLGHGGIKLQARNKLRGGKKLDTSWNAEIEREWPLFMAKRRQRRQLTAPSACGRLSGRQLAWLSLWTRAIDGECFVQLLKGYPHNRHQFAVRFLNPDLLDSTYCTELDNGNRIEMGIEMDPYDRAVAYHFDTNHPGRPFTSTTPTRQRIPADQIIHMYRMEYVGQLRGFSDFATIMPKAKMLNGVHEAVVIGWRVAAAKMGFFTSSDPEDFATDDEWDDEGNPISKEDRYGDGDNVLDATPGTIDKMPHGMGFELFDPEYPNATYESGHKVFMQQMANGLNVSAPSLANRWEDVNYSSLRQALLEDREGWRCIQGEMIDDFYQPLFDEWYDWVTHITGHIHLTGAKREQEPVVAWQPRGWNWVDPLKEVNAQIKANEHHIKTRSAILAETSGADFTETVDTLQEEDEALKSRGLVEETEAPNAMAAQLASGATHSFEIGDIVSRIGTDEQLIMDISGSGDLIKVCCIKAPHNDFCAVGDEEWNTPWRYELVRKKQ